MTSTITLLIACAAMLPTLACKESSLEEIAHKNASTQASDTTSPSAKEGLAGAALSPAARAVHEAAPLSLDCAAILSENDIQKVCGDSTIRMSSPNFVDHEANTSNIPCYRDYAGKARSAGWMMMGHTEESYAVDMLKFNLDYAKEEGEPYTLIEGFGPMAYTYSDTEVLHSTHIVFAWKNYHVAVHSPNAANCSLEVASLLQERLKAL